MLCGGKPQALSRSRARATGRRRCRRRSSRAVAQFLSGGVLPPQVQRRRLAWTGTSQRVPNGRAVATNASPHHGRGGDGGPGSLRTPQLRYPTSSRHQPPLLPVPPRCALPSPPIPSCSPPLPPCVPRRSLSCHTQTYGQRLEHQAQLPVLGGERVQPACTAVTSGTAAELRYHSGGRLAPTFSPSSPRGRGRGMPAYWKIPRLSRRSEIQIPPIFRFPICWL